MPVTLIRNNTGAPLQLFENLDPVGDPVPNGGAIQQVPITITSVRRGHQAFNHANGALVDGHSYIATFANATVTLDDNVQPVTYNQ